MTSQKRKSSEQGNTAKRQKLKQCESHSPKNRTRASSKAKTNVCSAQKSKTPKALANKAINSSKSSKAEAEQKRSTVLRATKKSSVKIVPAKGRSLRLAKEVTTVKKATQKSSTSASKAEKKSPSNVSKTMAKESSGSSRSNKIKKSSSKSPALKLTKAAKCVKKNVGTKTRCKSDINPVKKTDHSPPSKSSRNKAKKCEAQTKCNKQAKNVTSIKKQSVSSLKKQAPVRNTTVKESDMEPKAKAHKAAQVSQRATATRKTGIKPLQPISQHSVIPAASKDKAKRVNTKTRSTKKIKIEEAKSETCTKGVKKSCSVNQSENLVKSDSSSTMEKEITDANISIPGSSSNEMLDASLNEKMSGKASLKRKRNNLKPVDSTNKIKAKRQKVVQSEASKKQNAFSEDYQKSKRLSILDLCNEIAGEIESDTVEVVKGPGSPTSPPNEKTEDENTHNLADISPSAAAAKSPVNQLKRFFPSRKPVQIKSKLEKKTSAGARNSKWNKIKLKNNFAQNNILRKCAVLPSLEAIKAKVSPGRQLASGNPASQNSKKSDVSAMQNKQARPALGQKVKDITTQVPGSKDGLEKTSAENGLLENHIKHELEAALDEGFRLHLDSSPENSPLKRITVSSSPELKPSITQSSDCKQLTDQMAASAEKGVTVKQGIPETKSTKPTSDANIQKEIRKLKEANNDSSKQPIIDAGQKRFGAISCCVCGMLYTASNPEDEAQHLLFHNQFTSAVKYVGWKKERIVAEYPDGKIIMVLPDDPKYALKKVDEIREMVDNDLGFQQVPLRLHSRTKTLMFISSEKKVVGCLIAEHIQWGYRVIDDFNPGDLSSDTEKLLSERVKAWCCSTTAEPAICGVSRIWVFSMMRRKKIASRMLECLRNHFIYGSHLNKGEIAFSDPTPDGKLFAAHYCGTSQFLVYNFVSGLPSS